MREEANLMLQKVADLISTLRPEIIVKIAHMELCKPTIVDGFRACVEAGAAEIIVHPYMLSPGRHSTSDIPKIVAECAAEYSSVTFMVTGPLGVHQNIAEVVLERAGLI